MTTTTAETWRWLQDRLAEDDEFVAYLRRVRNEAVHAGTPSDTIPPGFVPLIAEAVLVADRLGPAFVAPSALERLEVAFAARRRMVARHAAGDVCPWDGRPWPCPDVRDMACVYACRDDYPQELSTAVE